jgi:alkaline phosphatase D
MLRSLILVCCLLASVVEAGKEPMVIIISMDGVSHNIGENLSLTAFKRMEKFGIKADHMIPVYQSTTYPAHVSMATGVYPDRHGILHNSFIDTQQGRFNYDADANWIEAPPIWVLAEQQGIKSAVFFWVGSETDWHGVGASYRKAPFDPNIKEEQKIEQILKWIDMDKVNRPRLIMSYWDGTDDLGHIDGPESPRVSQQLRRQNKLLQDLITAIDARQAWGHLTLIVVSDHGMAAVNNYINLEQLLRISGIKAELSAGPAVAHIFLQADDIEQAKYFLSKQEHLAVYTKKDLPDSFHLNHPSRTGDIVVTTAAPNMFSSYGQPKGMHGYQPETPDMWGIFYAIGAAIEHKELGPVHQIDLAPTIADILGIKGTDHMQGKIISLKDRD